MQGTSWADGLELVGDDERLIAHAGLLAEQTGLRHRSHVYVENVKQAKALGLNRWPSRHWAINVAWIQIVAVAANLLACFRYLTLSAGELHEAALIFRRCRVRRVVRR